MAKQTYTASNGFNEKKFIRDAENAQKELLAGPNRYLFDLEAYAKDLKGPAANSIELSVGFLESALYCAEIGSVLEAQLNLSDAKYFNRELPEDIITNVMKAAKLGGLQKFVKYLHTSNA